MRYGYSAHLRDDVNSEVQAAWRSQGIVNIALLAEAVRLKNLAENVALEDIEYMVMQAAQFYGAAMELEGLTAIDVTTFNPLSEDGVTIFGSLDAIEDRPIAYDRRPLDQIQ